MLTPRSFSLVETEIVEFNLVAMRRADFKKTEDMFNRVMTKDQIATVALLEHRLSGARLVVANVHMYWDHEYRDVKLVQAGILMDEIESIGQRFARLPARLNLGPGYTKAPQYTSGQQIPTLVCGDFNSVPKSGVYDFFTHGHLPPDHPDFMAHLYGAYTTDGLSHSLTLRSSYGAIGEMMTNYTPGFKGGIDYIWYTANALAVTGLLGPVDENWLKTIVGIPHAVRPARLAFAWHSYGAHSTFPRITSPSSPSSSSATSSDPSVLSHASSSVGTLLRPLHIPPPGRRMPPAGSMSPLSEIVCGRAPLQ
jgi:CCR4-NOT transcription complex subunit 6